MSIGAELDARPVSESYERRIAAARSKFLAAFPRKIGGAIEICNLVDYEVPAQRMEDLNVLHHAVHELCGTSGMLGLTDLNREGRSALGVLEAAEAEGRSLTTTERFELNAGLRRMAKMAEQLTCDA